MCDGARLIGAVRRRCGFVLWAASAGALLLTGCPENPPPDDNTPQNRELEIGVLQNGVYRTLSDNDEVPVVRGSQGGIHVDISLILSGFPTADEFLIAQRAVMLDTGEIVSPDAELLAPFPLNSSGHPQRDGQRVFLQGTQSTVRGRRATLTFTVSDFNDRSLSASASVVVTFVDAP